MTAQRAVAAEKLAGLITEAIDASRQEPSRTPLPAVLDTDFIRTGLHYQLRNGFPPKSVRMAQQGSLRMFMEYDTLTETAARLPKFAGQLGVPEADLRRSLNESWLPYISMVKLPASLRQADPRALQIRDRDTDDFPAAALAALLSPCLLLTCNYKHFGALGVATRSQAVDGVMAVAAVNMGELQMQATVMIPTAPVLSAGAAVKWAVGRFGPVPWVILGVLIGGGIYWYRKQPPERREHVQQVAGKIGTHLLHEYATAADGVSRARVRLRTCLVPSPQRPIPESAVLRELALSPDSLSAQQLADLLDPPVRPAVADLRAFLNSHDTTVFDQVRRGGFVLGSHYQLAD